MSGCNGGLFYSSTVVLYYTLEVIVLKYTLKYWASLYLHSTMLLRHLSTVAQNSQTQTWDCTYLTHHFVVYVFHQITKAGCNLIQILLHYFRINYREMFHCSNKNLSSTNVFFFFLFPFLNFSCFKYPAATVGQIKRPLRNDFWHKLQVYRCTCVCVCVCVSVATAFFINMVK